MPNTRSLMYLGVVAVAALLAGMAIYRHGHVPQLVPATVTVANPLPQEAATSTPFQFEIVKDEAAQERGLGGRTDVPEHYGMLFEFPNDQNIGFWMKDMLVPIDIIWLSDNGTILSVLDSVATSTYPDVFYPPQPVRYVLETKAGEAAREGWNIGTIVHLPL